MQGKESMKKLKYSWSEYGYCIKHNKVHKIKKGCKELVVTNKQILEEIAKLYGLSRD